VGPQRSADVIANVVHTQHQPESADWLKRSAKFEFAGRKLKLPVGALFERSSAFSSAVEGWAGCESGRKCGHIRSWKLVAHDVSSCVKLGLSVSD
jgi:hypothetical protein